MGGADVKLCWGKRKRRRLSFLFRSAFAVQ
jgi:hypothetical protein